MHQFFGFGVVVVVGWVTRDRRWQGCGAFAERGWLRCRETPSLIPFGFELRLCPPISFHKLVAARVGRKREAVAAPSVGGEWMVSEFEALDPELYFKYDSRAVDRAAAAVARKYRAVQERPN